MTKMCQILGQAQVSALSLVPGQFLGETCFLAGLGNRQAFKIGAK